MKGKELEAGVGTSKSKRNGYEVYFAQSDWAPYLNNNNEYLDSNYHYWITWA